MILNVIHNHNRTRCLRGIIRFPPFYLWHWYRHSVWPFRLFRHVSIAMHMHPFHVIIPDCLLSAFLVGEVLSNGASARASSSFTALVGWPRGTSVHSLVTTLSISTRPRTDQVHVMCFVWHLGAFQAGLQWFFAFISFTASSRVCSPLIMPSTASISRGTASIS